MLNILERKGKSGKCLCNCGNVFTVKNVYDAKRSKIGSLCNKCKYFISKAQTINKDFLNLAFHYNEETGDLRYALKNSLGDKGELATIKHSQGYLTTRINGKDYLAHRIIWYMKTGTFPDQIDHINHKKDENFWDNLREVNNQENQKNTSLPKSSKTKFIGVSIIKATSKYRAYIMVNYKQIHLGVFNTIDEAIEARKLAETKYNFHPNHGSV